MPETSSAEPLGPGAGTAEESGRRNRSRGKSDPGQSASGAPSSHQSTRPAKARFHKPELDALRFGAFFLVFLHHALPHASAEFAGLPQFAGQALAALGRAGALGVDLFFALSSYLITELLLREKRATRRLDVRAFYIRRILRIWPLYFFALLVLAPLMGYFDPSNVMPADYTVAFALLAGNWACAFGGYPASSFALLWSVSIEEQFYLAWPWLIRKRSRSIGGGALIMLAVATAARVVLAMKGTEHPGVWTNTLARLDPIAGGALLAYLLDGQSPRLTNLQRALLFTGGGLVLLGTGGFGPHDGWGALATYPVAAAAAVAVLISALGMDFFRQPGTGPVALAKKSLGSLGKISFGLYVFHAAALHIAPNAVLGLALTVAVAAMSYHLLEAPFLHLKERFARVQSRPV